MTKDEMNEIVEQGAQHHKRPANRMKKVRNILNIIFIVGVIIGMTYYFMADKTVGYWIIGISMAFKFVEATIRLLRL